MVASKRNSHTQKRNTQHEVMKVIKKVFRIIILQSDIVLVYSTPRSPQTHIGRAATHQQLLQYAKWIRVVGY